MLCTGACGPISTVLVLQAVLAGGIAGAWGAVAGGEAAGAALLAGGICVGATLAYGAVWRSVGWLTGGGVGGSLLAHLSGEAAKVLVVIGGLLGCLARFGDALPMLPFLTAFVAGLGAYLLALATGSVSKTSTQ